MILFSAPLDEPASKGKYTIITLSKGLQHLDRKKNWIKEDEMNPPQKASIQLLLSNPNPPRSPEAIVVPTVSHIEKLQIRPRQKSNKLQIRRQNWKQKHHRVGP